MDTICTVTRMTSLLAACLLTVGCKTPSPEVLVDSDEPYRTIRTSPLRDTDAAQKANDQGLTHLDAGELYQAEEAFKRAIQADVDFGPAHNNLGKLYFLKRKFYLAAHEFDDAIQLMPNHAAPHNNLGLTLLEAGKFDDAVDSLRRAVNLEPLQMDYQANLARALVERGDQSEELITLLHAIAARDERVPWRIWASHQLGTYGVDTDE